MFGIGSSMIPGVVQSGERKDDHGMWGGLWILAIIALFFIVALVFFSRGNDGNRSQIAEVAALSALNNRPQITPAESLAYTDLSGRFSALENRFDTQNQLNETRVVREAVATTNDNVTRASGDLTAEVRQNRNDITSALKDQNMFLAAEMARILENQNRIAREQEQEQARRDRELAARREAELLARINALETSREGVITRSDTQKEISHAIHELRERPGYSYFGRVA